MVPGRDDVEAAARRLRGVLVATPLIGGAVLPGFAVPPGLRIKLEVLQHGGSLWFRGAMHALARRLGAPREAVASGALRQVLAGVLAAHLQRIPVTAVVVGAPGADADRERALLTAAGAGTVEVVADHAAARARADELRRARGTCVVPGPGDPDHDLGVATLGLELAGALAADTDLVVVGPAGLADAVALGLAAGGRDVPVRGAPGVPADPRAAALRAAVHDGLRIDVDAEGLAALTAALEDRTVLAPCVVLGA